MTLSHEKQRLGIVYLLLLWCTALVTYRMYLAPDYLAVGMLWNLFLATVPLFWAAAFKWANGYKNRVLAGVFFLLWLLFFPNAPYLLTDMLHLGPRPGVGLWYLLAMLLSCAGTGALLGYFSLMDMQSEIEKMFNKPVGWLMAGGSLVLCGFGIYVGRFLRWNSWNALTSPLDVLRDVAARFVNPGPFPHPLEATLVFGVGLIIGYLALRVLAVPARAD